jgi:O-succinylbenzoate synthase
MKIDRIVLRQARMPLVHFFETSFGRTTERDIILVEVVSGGVSGWGEVTAGENPFYNEEWTDSAWLILRDYVGPPVLAKQPKSANDVAPLLGHIRGHRLATDRRRSAARDSLRRLHRHSGIRAKAARKD